MRHLTARITLILAMGAALGAPEVASAVTNLALLSDGASFFAASSHNGNATGANLTIMQDNLLTNTKTAWFHNGDKRYIFGHGDTNQWVEISLGQLRSISSIGAKIEVPPHDRYVVGPFSVEVSTDGSSWTDWGSPITISDSSPSKIYIDAPDQDIEYIKYFFGPTGSYYNHDGAAIFQVYAIGSPIAAPEPAAWLLMIAGMGTIGGAARRRATRLSTTAGA